MTDIERKVIYEKDADYVARTFDEAYRELMKVRAGIQCHSFMTDRMPMTHCASCTMYAADNTGEGKEKCMLQLALNYLAAVRNIAKTGKP